MSRADELAGQAAAAPAREGAELLGTWYLPLLAGVLPVLLLGFGYSALADRIVFVFWALALAACWVVLLRHGIEAGWSAARRWGLLLLVLAAGLGAFAWLERRHHEILDLGFRAVLPGLYTPAATRPATALVLAAACGLAGAAALAAGLKRPRPEREASA
jgi:hypothetical protein